MADITQESSADQDWEQDDYILEPSTYAVSTLHAASAEFVPRHVLNAKAEEKTNVRDKKKQAVREVEKAALSQLTNPESSAVEEMSHPLAPVVLEFDAQLQVLELLDHKVSEAKDVGSSRSYAISLYEEVARVHGKLIIPQIGRVMTTVTRSLSASGSSPQLHQACAKVSAALVLHSIDSDSTPAEAGDILKEVSRPLVYLLTGKLEHAAVGAATCMQALVESEKWKHAPADLVSDVCDRTTTALADKSSRTVAHMQLAQSLATMNPGTLNVYGACLIHAAEEILSSSIYSWQHRKCAAKMVQAVLGIVDRETLALEFQSITQVLENCKHDRMPHVRSAVCEALQGAKMIMTGKTIKEEDNGDRLGSMSSNPKKKTPQRRNWNSNKYSPSSQDTYNLSSYTPPPSACDDSATSDPFSTPQIGSTGRMKRSLLYPSKTDNYSFISSPVPATGLTMNHDLISVKENIRPSVLGGSIPNSRRDVSGHHVHNKLVGGKNTAGVQWNEKESVEEKDCTPTTVTKDHPKGKVESRFSPFEAQITRSFGEAEGDLMAEDEDILSRGSAELGYCAKNGVSIQGHSRFPYVRGQFGQESQTPESMGDSVQSNSISSRVADSGHFYANDFALPGKKGCGSTSMVEKVVDVLENKQIFHMSSLQGLPVGKPSVHDLNAGISHGQYLKLTTNAEDGFSALKPRVLITTADFLPFTTPRRLVLSLQSQLSSPGDEVGNDDEVRRIDDGAGTEFNEDAVTSLGDRTAKKIVFNEDADMDVESSSDSGWSVRDNPVGSDESATDESSDEEMEERHTEIYESFACARKAQSVAGVSPEKITVSSPPPLEKFLDQGNASDHSKFPENDELKSPTVEDTATCHLSPKPAGSPDTNAACSSCTESQRKSSAMKAQECDLGLDADKDADDQRVGARRSMLFEQVETLSDKNQGSPACRSGSVNEAVWINEGEPGSWWSSTSLLRSAMSSCSRITSIAEAVLGGSLCIVIAVPVTMLLARVLQSPADHFLELSRRIYRSSLSSTAILLSQVHHHRGDFLLATDHPLEEDGPLLVAKESYD